jgi:CheY-like chemotaxis protein
MNAIIGMTALAKNAEGAERKDYCLAKIEDASTHLLAVINDILDMSKIEANKLELSIVPFGFERLLRKTADVIQFRIDEKRQRFTVDIDSAIPPVIEGDDQRLAQVITNLLSNAVKFTPENGAIALRASLEKEEDGICTIRIEVSDTGIGISGEQRRHLFTSFEQADSGTSRKFGGTGLGLAISRRIVNLMGGDIHVESESGRGSRFIFTIQARRSAEESAEQDDPANRPPSETADFSGRRILVAEDVDINREILCSLLEPTGIAIDTAANGVEAVEKFRARPGAYDLILMDVQMPEMDGYEATRRIRAFEAETGAAWGAPIIALTANVFREDVEKCLAAGMNDHLGKPLVMEEVTAILRSYLPD